MIRTLAVAALVVLGASASIAPPKQTVRITLPGDLGGAFKPGEGVELAQQQCLSCHSESYVRTQPVLSAAQWRAEVVKMKNVYAAPIPDAQIDPIAAYLTANYGKP